MQIIQSIQNRIYDIRGERVMLDKDLIETLEKGNSLRLQIETSKGRGGTRYLPYAFTEQGVAMLSGVLHSDKAISMNIAIMRAFVEIRRILKDTPPQREGYFFDYVLSSKKNRQIKPNQTGPNSSP
jgi:hypothetical protein